MTREEEEEKGIEAIIYLQKLVGIVETREEAALGWKSMSDSERKATLEVLTYLQPATSA